MIPIGAPNPTQRRPILTYSLLAINVVVYLWQNSLSQPELYRAYLDYAVVPNSLTANPLSLEALLDSLRSMFMHGSWLHLGSNMLYLMVFGNTIEDRLGRVWFLPFYLLCGFVAIFAQVVINPSSPVPMVGASGAIAGILGGYFVLYPAARIRTIIFLGFIFFAQIRAYWLLGFWFAMQLVNGVSSLDMMGEVNGGTAFFAHIGGFVAGAIILLGYRVAFGAPQPAEPIPPTPKRRRPLPQQVYAAIPTEPASNEPSILPPDSSLSQERRVHLRTLNFDTLRDWEDTPVWMMTKGRTYYGRILRLSQYQVTIRESTGMVFMLPLENLIRIE